MTDTLNRLIVARANYTRALYDIDNAPQGNSLIDAATKEAFDAARAEYKSSIVEAIRALVSELAEME